MNVRSLPVLAVLLLQGCLKPAPALPPKLGLAVLSVKPDGTTQPVAEAPEITVGGQITLRANVQRPGYVYVFARASNTPKLVWGDDPSTPRLEVGEFEMEPPYAILYRGEHFFTAVMSPERLVDVAKWTDLSDAAIKQKCPQCSIATTGLTVP